MILMQSFLQDQPEAVGRLLAEKTAKHPGTWVIVIGDDPNEAYLIWEYLFGEYSPLTDVRVGKL